MEFTGGFFDQTATGFFLGLQGIFFFFFLILNLSSRNISASYNFDKIQMKITNSVFNIDINLLCYVMYVKEKIYFVQNR